MTAALAACGVRSSLVCGVVTGTLPIGLDEVRIIPGLADRRSGSDTARAVAATIAELDADVVYLHNVFDPDIVAAIAALAGRGVVLWYVHDHYLTCLSELRWRRRRRQLCTAAGHECLASIEQGHCVMRHPDRSHGLGDVGTPCHAESFDGRGGRRHRGQPSTSARCSWPPNQRIERGTARAVPADP